MRLLPLKIVVGFVGGLVVIGLWGYFAPTKLGGSTTYSVTSGISMEPRFHKNDLALVRSRSSYHVGEIVLYQNQVIHRPVLHRILLIQGDKYFFKGDNNSFVDPGYATAAQLTGSLWFSVPAVGSILGWFGVPFHAALLMGLAVMLIVLTGFATTTRRRDRGNRTRGSTRPHPKLARLLRLGPPTTAQRESDATAHGIGARRPQRFLAGPNFVLVTLGTLLLLATLFTGIGFSRPTHRPGSLAHAYQHAGTFSYSARANAPNDVYPNRIVRTGDPIYPGLVDTVKLAFAYRFTSSLPHQLDGTIQLRALVLSQTDTWTQVSTVVPTSKFTADNAAISTDVKLADLYKFIQSVATQTGIAETNYSVDLQPVVHVRGVVGGEPIDDEFSPILPFAITTAAVRLDLAIAPLPPGATYERTTAGTALASVVHPSQPGTIPHPIANDVSIARYQLSVSKLRVLGGVVFALLLLVALAHDIVRRSRGRLSEEELVAARLRAHIVPVSDLGSDEAHVDLVVPSFADLAGLALFLQRPILFEARNRVYAVDDDHRRYRTPAKERRRSEAGPGQARTDGRRASDPQSGERRSDERPAVDRRASDSSAGDRRSDSTAHDRRASDRPAGDRRGDGAAADRRGPDGVADGRSADDPSADGRRTDSGPGPGDAGAVVGRGPSRVRSWTRPQRVPKAKLAVRGAAVVVVVGVVATLTLSFTAGVSVPTSRVGTSVQGGAVTQASPAGCSTLPLVSLVLVSGSGTFTTSTSNALILGRSGVDTIHATGSRNCIVGGGGRDVVQSTSTSTCIIGPTTGATYSSCTKKAK